MFCHPPDSFRADCRQCSVRERRASKESLLDELKSLQRLPQLMTAVTENRKSNNPRVLGFQGKAVVALMTERRTLTKTQQN